MPTSLRISTPPALIGCFPVFDPIREKTCTKDYHRQGEKRHQSAVAHVCLRKGRFPQGVHFCMHVKPNGAEPGKDAFQRLIPRHVADMRLLVRPVPVHCEAGDVFVPVCTAVGDHDLIV